jgi:hypothetical protein
MEVDGAAQDRHTLYVNNLYENISQDGMRKSALLLLYKPFSYFKLQFIILINSHFSLPSCRPSRINAMYIRTIRENY